MSTPQRHSVLMIDDNVELTELVKQLFDPKEFLFVSAKDGTEGLLKARNQKFDVVVTDIRMPRMDGVTFVQQYRKLIKDETPLLLYSAHLEEVPRELKSYKNIYHLAKPSQGYELIERVRSLASLSHAPTETTSQFVYFKAGSFIFHEGDSGADGFMIEYGEVEIVKEFSNGPVAVIDTLEPGEFLGSCPSLECQFRFFAARAKTDVKAKRIPFGLINKEIDGHPDWFIAMVRGNHKRWNVAYQRLRAQIKGAA